MAHPDGKKEKPFPINHTFEEVYSHVGKQGITFLSTTGERIFAKEVWPATRRRQQ